MVEGDRVDMSSFRDTVDEDAVLRLEYVNDRMRHLSDREPRKQHPGVSRATVQRRSLPLPFLIPFHEAWLCASFVSLLEFRGTLHLWN